MKKNLEETYKKRTLKQIIIVISFLLVLIIFSMFAITLGSADITINQVWSAICHAFTQSVATGETKRIEKIILLLRMPRVLLGILAGIGLSISGTVMQSITRNPLVSPFTIGLSSAAAFGASLAIVIGIGFQPHTPLGIVINAFIMSLLCAILVYGIASRIGMSPEALILTGIALSYFFGALTATLQFIANENQLSSVIQWTFGSLNGATWPQVWLLFVIIGTSIPILLKFSWILNAMSSSGDEFIKGIGIQPAKMRTILGLITVVITASIISFTGVIGFVGLISPHIARLIVGTEHRVLIPVSGLIGGTLLLISDTIGRTLLSPITIPVGIIISYIGVPLFINLIITKRKEYF